MGSTPVFAFTFRGWVSDFRCRVKSLGVGWEEQLVSRKHLIWHITPRNPSCQGIFGQVDLAVLASPAPDRCTTPCASNPMLPYILLVTRGDDLYLTLHPIIDTAQKETGSVLPGYSGRNVECELKRKGWIWIEVVEYKSLNTNWREKDPFPVQKCSLQSLRGKAYRHIKCSGSEEGSYSRLIDLCITEL